MNVHFRNRHEPHPTRTEDIRSNAMNKGFVDPGYFIFKGRSAEKKTVHERQPEKRTVERKVEKKELNLPIVPVTEYHTIPGTAG